jgi:3-methyladenine DNA glycosylase AlkD
VPPAKPKRKPSPVASAIAVADVVAWLEQSGSQRVRDGMARYAIPADKAFGISVGTLQREAKRLGKNQALSLALWKSGHYEARMLAAFVGEPARVTSAQMDSWVREFDNWAICDTVCMHLFDRTPHAYGKVEQWSSRRDEFGKRAAFALLASLAVHDKSAADEPFLRSLALIEAAADDPRNFVKKSVNWALRAIGVRSRKLHTAALSLARKLAASSEPTPRWIGKDALRQLNKPAAEKRLARKR